MKTLFAAPAVWEDVRTIDVLLKSCELRGIDLQYFGIGGKWTHYHDIKVLQLLEFLKARSRGYTHIRVTDSADVLYLAREETINRVFESIGKPLLHECAAETYTCFDLQERFPPTDTRYRYITGGGYMGTVDAVIGALEVLAREHFHDDDLVSWSEGYLSGKIETTLDTRCRQFLASDGTGTWKWEQGRVVETSVPSIPCSIHFGGRQPGRYDLLVAMENYEFGQKSNSGQDHDRARGLPPRGGRQAL